jgi:2,3-diaminopropionate biosynthesis protein SbnA
MRAGGRTRAGAVVTVYDSFADVRSPSICVEVPSVTPGRLVVKLEGFNPSGSIKMKSAARMFEDALRAGRVDADSVLIESTSGNLGLALATIAASHGLSFVCVTDPRCNDRTLAALRALGAEVVVVDEPDGSGGFLGTRIDYVRRRCAEDPRLVWMDQYANPGNWQAHRDTTAAEILLDVPDLDVLFVGAGTCGTLRGCSDLLRREAPHVTLVGVDSIGSVIFGGAGGVRHIPGLGASIVPAHFSAGLVDDTVMVHESETVAMCRRLAEGGLLLGGSSGTVLAGAAAWLAEHDPRGTRVAVAISPDFGDRYLDSVYDDAWVAARFPSRSSREDARQRGAA